MFIYGQSFFPPKWQTDKFTQTCKWSSLANHTDDTQLESPAHAKLNLRLLTLAANTHRTGFWHGVKAFLCYYFRWEQHYKHYHTTPYSTTNSADDRHVFTAWSSAGCLEYKHIYPIHGGKFINVYQLHKCYEPLTTPKIYSLSTMLWIMFMRSLTKFISRLPNSLRALDSWLQKHRLPQ